MGSWSSAPLWTTPGLPPGPPPAPTDPPAWSQPVLQGMPGGGLVTPASYFGPPGAVIDVTGAPLLDDAIVLNYALQLYAGRRVLIASSPVNPLSILTPIVVPPLTELGSIGGGGVISPQPGFTGTAMIIVNGADCRVDDLQLAGQSAVVTSNPAANGIEVQPGSRRCVFSRLKFLNINGWAIEGLGDCAGSLILACNAVSTAGGYHLDGQVGNGGWNLVQAGTARTGVASGPNANLDALRIEDCNDVTGTVANVSVGNTTTGHAINILGASSNIRLSVIDSGGFPIPATGSGQCGLRIQSGTNGSPSDVHVSSAEFRTYDVGANISSGSNISLTDDDFQANNTTGVIVSSGGTGLNLHDCRFGTSTTNGQGTGTGNTYHDLDWQSTGHGTIAHCEFGSAIVAIGSAGVQDSIHFAASGRQIRIHDPQFTGAGTGAGNQVVNLPNLVSMPLLSGTATLTAGTVTVSQSAVAASTRIGLRVKSLSGAPGALFVSAIIAGTSFTVSSTSPTDTSVVEWVLYSGG